MRLRPELEKALNAMTPRGAPCKDFAFHKAHFARGVWSFMQRRRGPVGAPTAGLGASLSPGLSLGRALQRAPRTREPRPAFLADFTGAGGAGCGGKALPRGRAAGARPGEKYSAHIKKGKASRF